jgi:hypothetical protein
VRHGRSEMAEARDFIAVTNADVSRDHIEIILPGHS